MRNALLLLVAGIVGSAIDVQAQSTGLCRAADHQTALIIEHAVGVSRGADSDAVEDRALFGIPASVPDSAITVVADTTLCARLVQARDDHYRATGFTIPPTRAIYAIRFGPVYMVYDPTVGAGEFSTVHIYDGSFRPAGGWSGP